MLQLFCWYRDFWSQAHRGQKAFVMFSLHVLFLSNVWYLNGSYRAMIKYFQENVGNLTQKKIEKKKNWNNLAQALRGRLEGPGECWVKDGAKLEDCFDAGYISFDF